MKGTNLVIKGEHVLHKFSLDAISMAIFVNKYRSGCLQIYLLISIGVGVYKYIC